MDGNIRDLRYTEDGLVRLSETFAREGFFSFGEEVTATPNKFEEENRLLYDGILSLREGLIQKYCEERNSTTEEIAQREFLIHGAITHAALSLASFDPDKVLTASGMPYVDKRLLVFFSDLYQGGREFKGNSNRYVTDLARNDPLLLNELQEKGPIIARIARTVAMDEIENNLDSDPNYTLVTSVAETALIFTYELLCRQLEVYQLEDQMRLS